MKLIFAFIFISSVNLSFAQDISPKGDWRIIEFSVINEDGTEKMTQRDLNKNKSFWDLSFMKGGKFLQTSNMSGSEEMLSHEGIWEVDDKNLNISIEMDGKEVDLNYIFTIENDVLVLTRTNPKGNMKIISKFIRKK